MTILKYNDSIYTKQNNLKDNDFALVRTSQIIGILFILQIKKIRSSKREITFSAHTLELNQLQSCLLDLNKMMVLETRERGI